MQHRPCILAGSGHPSAALELSNESFHCLTAVLQRCSVRLEPFVGYGALLLKSYILFSLSGVNQERFHCRDLSVQSVGRRSTLPLYAV